MGIEIKSQKISSGNPESDLVLPPENNAVANFAKKFAQLEYELESPEYPFNPTDIKRIEELAPDREAQEILAQGGNRYYEIIDRIVSRLDERKGGFFHSLCEKQYRTLLKASPEEQLEIIRNTLSTTEKLRENKPDQNLSRLGLFDRWCLRFLAGSRNESAVIEVATDYLVGYHGQLKFEARLDQWELGQIFKKNPKLSSEKLLTALEKELASKENIPITVLLLTDLIGAEEALMKINKLIIEKEKSDPQAAENLEFARTYLVPVKNKKIFAELESFYREFNIKEHQINKDINEREVALLKKLIPRDGKVLESGCGTGRLLLALKNAGYNVSGYDLLPENVDEVLKENPEADVSVDDWYHTKYPDENFDAVYSLGRNILHEYSLPGQIQLFREAHRVLKKGGKFIFDVPDREKGIYAKNIKAYKEAMNREGIRNIREGTVYDSPNGEHFSTRYCFSREDIKNLARLTGFRIAEVRREELPTGKGDENLYFVLEKT